MKFQAITNAEADSPLHCFLYARYLPRKHETVFINGSEYYVEDVFHYADKSKTIRPPMVYLTDKADW